MRLAGDEEKLPAHAVDVLRLLAKTIHEPEKAQEARDLLIRLLENRGLMGGWTVAIDALLREVGLFPYVETPVRLDTTSQLAFEFNRPMGLPEIVFHAAQGDVYRQLMAGENLVLSAPTSFGKSAITQAVIASGRFKNIVIVVPTIALVDETRRKCASHSRYRVITQGNQEPGERNIFVLTPERVNDREDLGATDFFVIDEFYKLGIKNRTDDRATALNQAFYKLWKTGAQFYMIGPSIDAISPGFTTSFNCKFLRLDTTTVVTDIYHIRVPESEKLAKLVDLIAAHPEATLIYCNSPDSANKLARTLSEQVNLTPGAAVTDLADWTAREFHEDWTLSKALRAGVGVHHGRIPRALQQAQIRAFDAGELRVLCCTSTIIEGVNTAAKNVIVWDNALGKEKLDFFTFSNIRGRTGRMFRHFVGRVFVFEDPPVGEETTVDLPIHDQHAATPLELLVQMDEPHLKQESKERVAEIPDHPVVGMELARRFKDVNPLELQAAADALIALTPTAWRKVNWSNFPTKEQLAMAAELMWAAFSAFRPGGGVTSAKVLTTAINQARTSRSLTQFIHWRLQNFDGSADDIIETALDQYRTWVTFRFPRYLRVLDTLQREVGHAENRRPGDFRFFASQLEHFFLPPGLFALDEYGVPVQVAVKLEGFLRDTNSIDSVLAELATTDLEALHLHPAEKRMVAFALSRGLH